MTTLRPDLPTTTPLRHVVDTPPPELLASWSRRVLAVVLDHALIAAVTFLLLPLQPVTPLTLPGLPPTAPGGVLAQYPGSDNDGGMWWVAALVAVMMLGQAYTGSTPGKLVTGIAVVRRHDARPAGLLRTALRALVHVLDGLVLMIGFLRPLWHPARQTWADSAAGTVVLRTSAPRPFLWVTEPDPPPPWERQTAPRWRRAAWWVVAALCGPALVLTYGPSSGTGATRADEWCADRGQPAPDGTFTLVDGSVAATRVAPATVTRLGIERRQIPTTDDDVRVAWHWEGESPAEPVELRVAFTSADGSVTRTVHARLDPAGYVEPDWTSSLGPTSVDGDHLVIPRQVLDPLGPDWTWEVSATTAQGRDAGRCSGPGDTWG